jgi:hypothetical protein
MESRRATQDRISSGRLRSGDLVNAYFFLHDGRTNALTAAIAAHGADATTVINNFNNLSKSDQQASTSCDRFSDPMATVVESSFSNRSFVYKVQ